MPYRVTLEIEESCNDGRWLNDPDTGEVLGEFETMAEAQTTLGRLATMYDHPPKVVVEVRGGVAEVMAKPAGVEVVVKDWDNEAVDGDGEEIYGSGDVIEAGREVKGDETHCPACGKPIGLCLCQPVEQHEL